MIARILTASLIAATVIVSSAAAQDIVAEVRTWDGATWRLTQPSLEVFYTIMPAPKDSGGAAAPAAPSAVAGAGTYGASGVSGGGSSGAMFFGSVKDLSSLVAPGGPPSLQGRARLDVITVARGGVETQVSLGSVASIAFSRQLVAGSGLPPYWAGSHFRSGATVTLTDGSRIEADYVNLGTSVVRGMTPQGRVDIPWGDIQVLTIQR